MRRFSGVVCGGKVGMGYDLQAGKDPPMAWEDSSVVVTALVLQWFGASKITAF